MKFPPVPIALFTYRRLGHTQRTIEALAANHGANESDLVIYSDAARDQFAEEDVRAVRSYLGTVSGFRSLRIIEREKNLGLAQSIIRGVTEMLAESENVIVVEDDLVTAPYFLRYMNDGVRHYQDDPRVVSVHGYVYPVNCQLPETFFLRGADCWGWATWRRGWSVFNPDGTALLSELKDRKLTWQFDFDGTYGYTKMLEDQIAGANDSWAVRWYASAFLREKLTLYPGRSLVQNIGNDLSGTHCGVTTYYDVQVSQTPVKVGGIEVKPSQIGGEAFIEFASRNQASSKFTARLRRILTRLVWGA